MNTRKAQKKVLPHRASKLKQRSSNQPLLVRGRAEWKRLFHTFLWRMCLSLSSLRVGSERRPPPSDVGVKFLTLLNEFPRKGGRQSAEGEREDRKGVKFKHVFNFQFLLHPLPPFHRCIGVKKRDRGRPGKRGGNEDDSQDRQNFEKGRKERRDRPRPSSSTASCSFKPQKQSKLNMGFQTAILAFHYLL